VRVLAIARAAGGGDLHPVVALALGLRRRGHDVLTLSDAAPATLPPELGPFADEALFATATDRGRAAMAAMDSGTKEDAKYARYFETVYREIRDGLRAHIRRVAPDYVLTPLLLGPATADAVEGAVPWCVVNSTYTFGDDLSAITRLWVSSFSRATLVVHATDEVFDGGGPLPEPEHRVGPLFWEPPADLPAYVDEPGPPWVLVAISSVPQGDVALVAPVLADLARHRVRVVATIGPNDPDACGQLPPNARLERFVPHLAFLERAVLLVGHAGHGSVMKGLWSGVPMVLVPWGRDQPGVAARGAPRRRADRPAIAGRRDRRRYRRRPADPKLQRSRARPRRAHPRRRSHHARVRPRRAVCRCLGAEARRSRTWVPIGLEPATFWTSHRTL
jgi:UDP:flavonoid glycosyltransferase YjiC (YdhE family)